MESKIFEGIISGVIIILIGSIYCVQNKKIGESEKKTNAIGIKLDNKVDKDICEEHRRHQTEVNINIIERLVRIETKMDALLNGRHGK